MLAPLVERPPTTLIAHGSDDRRPLAPDGRAGRASVRPARESPCPPSSPPLRCPHQTEPTSGGTPCRGPSYRSPSICTRTSQRATIVSRWVGFIQVATVTAGPQTVTRRPRMITMDGRETVTLTLMRQETAERSQDGRDTVVRPGQFALSDSRRPFREVLRQPFSLTSLHFSRSALGVSDPELRGVTVTSFGRDEPLAVLLASSAIDLLTLFAEEQVSLRSQRSAGLASAGDQEVHRRARRRPGAHPAVRGPGRLDLRPLPPQALPGRQRNHRAVDPAVPAAEVP
ncbi:hypothetical protein ABT215_34860 [Streptomyces sp900105755]|uniref:AraC-like ligand-binding domain-containing protein n=1 Tax=Streptomyces sp. 900105755 TaxID=3154389 RepID=UPI00331C979F